MRLFGRALNGITDGRYRGALEISPAGPKGLSAVNALPIDTYIQGVVAGEMPSSWDLEALKVQAVAARSYALTTDAGGDLFDQFPDTRSQVYKGVEGETDRTNAAVAGTGGEILRYRGAVATTYYSSSSGGQTENVEHAFPGGAPAGYLRSVQDPADRISPNYRWTARFTPEPDAAPPEGPRPRAAAEHPRRGTGVSPRVVDGRAARDPRPHARQRQRPARPPRPPLDLGAVRAAMRRRPRHRAARPRRAPPRRSALELDAKLGPTGWIALDVTRHPRLEGHDRRGRQGHPRSSR